MNKDRIIELAREVGAGEPESLYGRTDYVVMTVGDLERFAALIEREVRGDAEPVASVHIKDGCLIGSQRKSDADFPDGQYGLYPIGTFPAPAVDAEPVAWMYTLEYGDAVADKKVSLSQLNYPFGVCGADYLRENSDGMSYVRQTPLYAQPVSVSNQKPVAWMCKETKILYENDTSAVDKYHGFIPTVPLYTHPAPAVVRQLVEALEAIVGDGVQRVAPQLQAQAKAALAAAKESGL